MSIRHGLYKAYQAVCLPTQSGGGPMAGAQDLPNTDSTGSGPMAVAFELANIGAIEILLRGGYIPRGLPY